MFRWLLLVAGLLILPTVASAQDNPTHYSQCQAIADHVVKLTFIGHSTFYIETPGGVTIATDYNGYVRPPLTPRVATMNRAHTTHYTLTPDPGIHYILHGWSDDPAQKAQHHLVVGDTLIRNVTSDIRGGYSGFEKDGNSIFIFEVAGLCIGHLGHLHQELSEGQYAEIGRLDVLMVPVDSGLTMGAVSMSKVVQRLRASLILPMHRPGPSVARFLAMFGPDYDVKLATSNSLEVSLKTLPAKPQIPIMQGMQ